MDSFPRFLDRAQPCRRSPSVVFLARLLYVLISPSASLWSYSSPVLPIYVADRIR